ncbi:TonB-dependent siderophore receptor family protein 7 [Achromobacter xylosoxidans A8]|uniref:TonB-dependent siderophore receptor family protein 7 n=1 Tax=Achromobacter xylosoxidans (strain A8) TaxID=762376 RepID=E3HPT8_ACHXA|nr:TonB-dependent siderophore receptor [Achromobacter xylosoxidans]ADP15922.1 TonB-dependent siderophore receptor family protein 7 [Achromobacter xylosoxidans A8]
MTGPTHADDFSGAKSDVPETMLPAVTVEAAATPQTATGPVPGYVAERSLTGTKTNTPLTEIPQSISVIGRDELDDRGALSVVEALRYVPGVASQTYGADTRGQDDWINLRGFSGYGTSLYQDGLRMNANAGGFASQRSEPYGLERIEVLRGPASVLYGKGDAGGIVNRVSKRPAADAPREMEVQIGNQDRRQLAVDLGGALDEEERVLYRIIGLGMRADTQDKYANGDEVSNTRRYLAPSLTWKPTPDTSLTLLSEFLRDRNNGFAFRYTPPGGSTRKSASLLEGEPKYSIFDQDQSSVGYLFEHRLNSAWSVRQNARLSEVDVTYRRIISSNLENDGRTLQRQVRKFKDINKQIAVDTQLEGQFKTGDIAHTLLFGLDAERQNNGRRAYSGNTGPLDIYDPIYGQPVTESPISDIRASRQRLRQLGLYVQDQVKLTPNWLITLGGRNDWTMLKSLNYLADTSTAQRANKFTKRLGISYLTGTGWTPYFSYAESFLPTVGRGADNAPFKPTEGKQYEAGLKYTPDNGRSLYTVALYDLRKTNVLTVDTANPDYLTQSGAVRSRGIELEAKAALAPGMDLIATYTFGNVKITKSNGPEKGKVPTTTPRQMASAWLNYRLQESVLRGLGMGFGVRYVGSIYNDEANTSKTPSFTLFDATLQYDSGPWRFALSAQNLADKEYVSTCYQSASDGSQCQYGQERTAVLSARYRF